MANWWPGHRLQQERSGPGAKNAAKYPSQFINANTIAPDILLQTFTLLYFGNLVEYVQTRQTATNVVWMSIALACGMLVKPVLYPFAIVHVVMVSGHRAYA
jgi:hypothetical protein